MTKEQSDACDALADALRALNRALDEAHKCGLTAKISSVGSLVVGRPGVLEIYSAEVFPPARKVP